MEIGEGNQLHHPNPPMLRTPNAQRSTLNVQCSMLSILTRSGLPRTTRFLCPKNTIAKQPPLWRLMCITSSRMTKTRLGCGRSRNQVCVARLVNMMLNSSDCTSISGMRLVHHCVEPSRKSRRAEKIKECNGPCSEGTGSSRAQCAACRARRGSVRGRGRSRREGSFRICCRGASRGDRWLGWQFSRV